MLQSEATICTAGGIITASTKEACLGKALQSFELIPEADALIQTAHSPISDPLTNEVGAKHENHSILKVALMNRDLSVKDSCIIPVGGPMSSFLPLPNSIIVEIRSMRLARV